MAEAKAREGLKLKQSWCFYWPEIIILITYKLESLEILCQFVVLIVSLRILANRKRKGNVNMFGSCMSQKGAKRSIWTEIDSFSNNNDHQFSPPMLIFVVTLYQRHVQMCRMVSLNCWSLSLLHWFHSAMYKHLKRLIKVNICQAA